MLKKLVLPVWLLMILGGCAVTADEAETVCIVKHANLQSPELLQAIRAGVEGLGYSVNAVDASAIPEDCRFCLYYGVRVERQKIQAIEFQGVRDGRALVKGSGPADDQGRMTYAAIASYAAAYLNQADADAPKRSEDMEMPANP